MTAKRPGPVLRAAYRAPVLIYRAGLGRLLRRRFLMISHVGRRTGRGYDTVVEVVDYLEPSDEFVVLSGYGRSSDWFCNLEAGGARAVTVGARTFRPEVRHLTEDEAATAVERYERRHWLIDPAMRRMLTWLLGWQYTATEEDRRRMVRQLPVLGLRPSAPDGGPGTDRTR
jgi:deazaflavin-dependent oxidoreductase (nitroreductase family)